MNTLYYGDNLPILRSMPSESVDLIYLDPPFNSSRSYNVLFKDETGLSSDAQITAFDDTWHWGQAAEQAYADLILEHPCSNTPTGAVFPPAGRPLRRPAPWCGGHHPPHQLFPFIFIQ